MAVIGTVGSAGMKKQKIGEVLHRVWTISAPYWLQAEERWGSLGLLAINVFMLIFNTSFIAVRNTQWNADWMDAFTTKNGDKWIQQLSVFMIISISSMFVLAFNNYIAAWIQIRWRRWLTGRYLRLWMENSAHYKMHLSGNETDNPDQRITDDLEAFIANTWLFAFNFVQNVISLFTYSVILWDLSATVPLLFGTTGGFDGHGNYSFPGHFIVVAILHAALSTGLTHWIGKPLTRLQFDQRMHAANFRFALVRFRENSEQIALMKGEDVEHNRMMNFFGEVVTMQCKIMGRNMRMQWVASPPAWLNVLLFSVLLGPAYFWYDAIESFGTYSMIAGVLLNVSDGFSWFRTWYGSLALYVTVIDRMYAFNVNYDETVRVMQDSDLRFFADPKDEIGIKDIDVYLPTGKLQISAKAFDLKRGEKILVKGRTGAGKTTLFRVIAGIWPYAKGSVTLPSAKRIIVLPQRPYFPIGTLMEAISYPEPADTYKREDVRQALIDVGLSHFSDRLDEVAHWNMMMSGGEQQRAAVARAMLYHPDYLFFDEATSAMDEQSEEELYSMLLERMKESAIISIGHRSSLEKFHKRLLFAESVPGGSYEFQEKPISFESGD